MAALVTLACGPKVEVGDDGGSEAGSGVTSNVTITAGSATTPSTTGTTVVDTSVGDVGDVDGGVSVGVDAVTGFFPDWGDVGQFCPNPDHACLEPLPCDSSCGDPFSPFDFEGCLRFSCLSDVDCAPDERCFAPADYGGCASSGIYCYDDPELGACTCTADPDCGGQYCVPASVVPAGNCNEITDAQVCLATLGCDTIPALRLELALDQCICEYVDKCIWVPDGLDPGPVEGAFLPGDTSLYFFYEWFDPPPPGWALCGQGLGDPAACGLCDPTSPTCP